MRMHAGHIELAVAQHFGTRQNCVVPNVYWGLGLQYEADIVVLRPSGYAIEVEIKVTRADVKADARKRHGHDSPRFRQLWFALPAELAAAPDIRDLIPAKAGILAVEPPAELTPRSDWFRVTAIRGPKVNKAAKPWSDRDIRKLHELGVMRIWTLKQVLLDRCHREVKPCP